MVTNWKTPSLLLTHWVQSLITRHGNGRRVYSHQPLLKPAVLKTQRGTMGGQRKATSVSSWCWRETSQYYVKASPITRDGILLFRCQDVNFDEKHPLRVRWYIMGELGPLGWLCPFQGYCRAIWLQDCLHGTYRPDNWERATQAKLWHLPCSSWGELWTWTLTTPQRNLRSKSQQEHCGRPWQDVGATCEEIVRAGKPDNLLWDCVP